MLSSRSHQKEWIDLGPSHYSPEEYRDCLYQLDRIGRFLGGDQASFWALDQLKNHPNSILDVGCGGGLFTQRLAKKYSQAKVTGIDISSEAITFAKEQLKNNPSTDLHHLEFIVPVQPELDIISQNYDVVISTLVCHHLSDDALIHFIKESCRIAQQRVIINDLHRNIFATLGYSLVVPLFFRNRLIWHDGLLSIRRSFTRQDWQNYLNAAGIAEKYVSITWHWAFRWIIIIDTAAMRASKNCNLNLFNQAS